MDKSKHRKHNFSGGKKHRHNFYIPDTTITSLKAIALETNTSLSCLIVSLLNSAISDYTQQKNNSSN